VWSNSFAFAKLVFVDLVYKSVVDRHKLFDPLQIALNAGWQVFNEFE